MKANDSSTNLSLLFDSVPRGSTPAKIGSAYAADILAYSADNIRKRNQSEVVPFLGHLHLSLVYDNGDKWAFELSNFGTRSNNFAWARGYDAVRGWEAWVKNETLHSETFELVGVTVALGREYIGTLSIIAM